MSIRCRPDAKVSGRYRMDVDPRAFTIRADYGNGLTMSRRRVIPQEKGWIEPALFQYMI